MSEEYREIHLGTKAMAILEEISDLTGSDLKQSFIDAIVYYRILIREKKAGADIVIRKNLGLEIEEKKLLIKLKEERAE